MLPVNRRLINVLQLGAAFFFLFTAHQTCANILQYVISSVSVTRNGTDWPVDKDGGYYGSAIMYGFFTVSNLVAPAIIKSVGEKWSMFSSSLVYILYMVSFFHISNILLYTSSALLGMSASVLWIAQGSYLAKNSDDTTASKNAGLFFAIFETSFCIGGLFVFFQFSNEDNDDGTGHQAYLSESTIFTTYASFIAITIVGSVVLLLLSAPPPLQSSAENEKIDANRYHEKTEKTKENFCHALTNMIGLMKKMPVLWFIVVFVYSGIAPAFMMGVYGTSLANTLSLPAHKQMLALNIALLGVGEIVAGLTFGIFSKQLNNIGRKPILLIMTFIAIFCYIMIFINIPVQSPSNASFSASYLTPPSGTLALICSFLLGFNDACWNTQIYSFLSTALKGEPAIFGLFRFFQSAAACISFFYSAHMFLHWQLLILSILCPLACLGFVGAERSSARHSEHHCRVIRV